MICIQRDSTDPYFNIAAEEYIFQYFQEDVITLWINDPSIIVGKHQNTLAEINMEFVRKLNIPVIRRISGGGTVYHDHGNLNYTFIRKGKQGQLVDYAKHTKPITDALQELGIDARLEGKSNLTISGLKFSGNAEHLSKDRVLHHGTLLFDTDLSLIDESIRLKHQDYNDKGVRSIRSKVTNIKDHLQEAMSIHAFRDFLISFFLKDHMDMSMYQMTDQQKTEIHELAEKKYKTWDWNFGYSPKYNLQRQIQLGKDQYDLHLSIEQGRIKDFILYDKKGPGALSYLTQNLIGTPHEENAIRNKLNSINFAIHLDGFSIEDFIQYLF